jgi:hypothetical protein
MDAHLEILAMAGSSGDSARREGGCACGAVRYAMTGDPVVVALCHCNSCRRSAGAPVMAWAMYPRESFALLRGERALRASSPGASRGFCARCGTQLSWEGDALPGMIDMTVGSFDDPSSLAPAFHIWDSVRIPWLKTADSLPRHAEFPPGPPPS